VWPSSPVGVLCGALPSVWVPCLGPLCRSPVWALSVWVPCVGPLCGSPVWVPRPVALRHVASTRVMSPARSHAPAYLQKHDTKTARGRTEAPRGAGTPTQQGTGGRELVVDEDRQPTKTESRRQYRREDQYLCIEIHPFEWGRRVFWGVCRLPWG